MSKKPSSQQKNQRFKAPKDILAAAILETDAGSEKVVSIPNAVLEILKANFQVICMTNGCNKTLAAELERY